MKLDAYGIKSAMMAARWDEAAVLLDGHFGLPGIAVGLLKRIRASRYLLRIQVVSLIMQFLFMPKTCYLLDLITMAGIKHLALKTGNLP